MIEEIMEPIFRQILNMSITGSYVILVIMLIRLLLKKAPKKWSYLLWSAAAFRLTCPVSFESFFSIFTLKPFDMSAAQEAGAQTLIYIPENIGMMAQPEVTVGIPYLNSAISSSLPAATPMYSANPMQIWMAVFSLLWALGIAVLVLYSAITLILLVFRLRNAVKIEKGVYCSERVRSPFVLGIVKPRIYLPYGLDEDTMRYVLTHERLHIKRLDHIVKPLAYFILVLHWFNPLCWVAFMLMTRDMEMSCDERVLEQDEGIRKAYGITLLSFAANRRFPAPAPLAFGESGVKIRIKNILNWKKPALWISIAAIVLCIAAILACAANPQNHPRLNNSEKSTLGIFHVTEVLYDAPMYSFTVTPENAPIYKIEEGTLYSGERINAINVEIPWTAVGKIQEAALTKENFDDLIVSDEYSAFDPELFRESIVATKRIDASDSNIYHLLLEDILGRLYLTYGYDNTDTEGFKSNIRWIFSLTDVNDTSALVIKNITYVSGQCIYMSPLSSAVGSSDSGMLYYFTEDSFTVQSRQTDSKTTGELNGHVWHNWPYKESDLKQFFPLLSDTSVFDRYGKKYVMVLNNEYNLWSTDIGLCIVKFSGTGERRTVWSIYTLVPEPSQPSVLWSYRPMSDRASPCFTFSFDFDFDELSVSCTLGNMGSDAIGPKHQVVHLTKENNTACWYPVNDGEIGAVQITELTFTAVKNGEYAASGSIYIRQTVPQPKSIIHGHIQTDDGTSSHDIHVSQTQAGTTHYIAHIVSNQCTLVQSDTEGAIVQSLDEEAASN